MFLLWLGYSRFYPYPSEYPWSVWINGSYDKQSMTKPSQIAKFMGPTWGPPGSCRPQMGPMLAPWTLLSGTCIFHGISCACELVLLEFVLVTNCASSLFGAFDMMVTITRSRVEYHQNLFMPFEVHMASITNNLNVPSTLNHSNTGSVHSSDPHRARNQHLYSYMAIGLSGWLLSRSPPFRYFHSFSDLSIHWLPIKKSY